MENSTANIRSTEPKGPQPTDYGYGAYNEHDKEYLGQRVEEGAEADADEGLDDLDQDEDTSDLDDIDHEYGELESEGDDDMNLEEESDLEDEDDEPAKKEKTNLQLGEQWRVTPDYGELDPTIMSREADIKNGEKSSGWTNPLSWTDDGSDDNLVV